MVRMVSLPVDSGYFDSDGVFSEYPQGSEAENFDVVQGDTGCDAVFLPNRPIAMAKSTA